MVLKPPGYRYASCDKSMSHNGFPVVFNLYVNRTQQSHDSKKHNKTKNKCAPEQHQMRLRKIRTRHYRKKGILFNAESLSFLCRQLESCNFYFLLRLVSILITNRCDHKLSERGNAYRCCCFFSYARFPHL